MENGVKLYSKLVHCSVKKANVISHSVKLKFLCESISRTTIKLNRYIVIDKISINAGTLQMKIEF